MPRVLCVLFSLLFLLFSVSCFLASTLVPPEGILLPRASLVLAPLVHHSVLLRRLGRPQPETVQVSSVPFDYLNFKYATSFYFLFSIY